MSTFDRIKRILVEHLGADPDRVTDTTMLTTDLGADSLDEAELVMALEEEFDIETTDDDAEKFRDSTVGKLVEESDKLLASKPA